MIVMGIDVGGSGIKGVPVELETGEFVERFRLATPEDAKPDDVAETVARVANKFEWSGLVGVGFPAAIRKGTALTAANIHETWIDTNAEQLFGKKTGCPVYVVNDADAAGLAEMHFGVGQVWQKGVVIMITIGTGLGTA